MEKRVPGPEPRLLPAGTPLLLGCPATPEHLGLGSQSVRSSLTAGL